MPDEAARNESVRTESARINLRTSPEVERNLTPRSGRRGARRSGIKDESSAPCEYGGHGGQPQS